MGDVTIMAESKNWIPRMIHHIANKLYPVKGSVTTILYRLFVHIATEVMAWMVSRLQALPYNSASIYAL